MNSRRSWGAVLVGVVVAAWPAAASAAPATRLVYSRESGAERCADEAALRSAVAQRLGYDPFFPWAKVTLVATVRREAGAYRAHITLVDGEGIARGTRDLEGAQESCAELLSAMALGISIALDMLDPRPPEPEPTPAPAPAPPPEAPREPPPPSPPPPGETAPPEAPAPTSRFEVGAGALVGVSVMPATSPGADVFVRLRDAWWSVGVEAAFDAPTSKTDRFDQEASAFGVSGAIVPCAHYGWLGACGIASLGLVHASAVASGTSAVASFGLRAMLEVPVAARLSVRLHGDVVAPLARTRLEVDAEPLWTAPAVGGRLGLGVAYRFW